MPWADLLLNVRSFFLGLMLMPTPGAEADTGDVVLLARSSVPAYRQYVEAFRDGCRCRATVVELEGRAEAIAERVRSLRPAWVVAVGRSALHLSVERLSDQPLMHAMTVNPWTIPGASKIPGFAMNLPPSFSLDTLRALRPGVKRLGVVYNRKKMGPLVDEIGRLMTAHGGAVDARPVENTAEALAAMESVLDAGVPLLLVPDPLVVRREILDHVFLRSWHHRVPVIGFTEEQVRRGALFAWTSTPRSIAAESSRWVEHRLWGKGSAAQAREPLLWINEKVAAHLGLKLPSEWTARRVGTAP